MKWIQQVVIYLYTYIIIKKEVINLKGNEERELGDIEMRKGKREYGVTIFLL